MLIAIAALALAGATMPLSDECRASRTCVFSGTFVMSSDGHGFIGQLTTPSGCLNVSIPDREARRLLRREPSPRKFSGRILPYAMSDDVFEQRVNGRKIGRGQCGDEFLFVK
jgi:hypothetical protein